jgi:plastocyanin
MKSTHSLIKFLISIVISAISLVWAPLPVFHRVSAEPQAQEKEQYRWSGAEGSLSGKVSFEGAPPARKRFDMSQDRNCFDLDRNPKTEDVVVAAGGLANVFVYVRGAQLEQFAFETPEAGVVLDQQRCRFVPHVLGIQTGQPFTVFNSDPTTHNVHPAPRLNQEWNQSQAPDGPPIEKKFTRAEVLIPVKCNQHPWMKAYVGVLAHPFFAVSTRDGSFRIDRLPPGDYTVVAWHEVFGEQTAKVTIGQAERNSVDFTFSATPSTRSSSLSLRMESPLVVR